MAQDEPKAGRLYTCEEQSEMHGDDTRSTLPSLSDKVTLIRFRLDMNPDGDLAKNPATPVRSQGWQNAPAGLSR